MRTIDEFAPAGHQQADDWTGAFAAACEALRDGGGVLCVPPGVYHTGPIRLHSDMTLLLEPGATLRFASGRENYPLMDGEFEGVWGKIHMPCVFADGARNVRICGGGTLDGNGFAWWQAKREGTLSHPRPYLVHLRDCERVVIEGIQLVNSPCWTVHPQRCQDVSVRGVRIENPADSPNTDGINPNACSFVRISDCHIDVGDDCIAIKSGTEDTPEARPCESIVISGCTMAHGHGGVVIGSEMSGGVRNVLVQGCVMRDTDRGIRIKTRRGRGGVVENLQFTNILMEGVSCPLVINSYYFCGKDGRSDYVRDKAALPADARTPVIRDVRVSQLTVRGATSCAGFLHGLPEAPIEDVSLTDCSVHMRGGKADFPAMMDGLAPMEARGLFLRHVQGLTLRGVRVQGESGLPMDSDESVKMA